MKPLIYTPESHRVELGEPLVTPRAALKWYTLWSEYDAWPLPEARELVRTIAQDKLTHHIPALHAGLGLAILSQGFLNLVLWDEKTPSIVHPHLYSLTPRKTHLRHTIRKEDITKAGPFCMWEIGVIDRDRKYWKQFLTSPQTPADRETYLTTGFSGRIE